jgi:NAD(P)H-dependent FMN reductase
MERSMNTNKGNSSDPALRNLHALLPEAGHSHDYDADFPPVARAFKEALRAVDALLFVTPEYNRSIPGGLKNAIDWASRPYGTNSFTNKPSAVIGKNLLARRSPRVVRQCC